MSGGSGISCQANNVPEALITVGAAKEVRDDIDGPAWGALRGEADDADTVEEWEYVRREDLVEKHRSECRPEELQTLVISLRIKVEGWRSDSQRRITIGEGENILWKIDTVGRFCVRRWSDGVG